MHVCDHICIGTISLEEIHNACMYTLYGLLVSTIGEAILITN